MPEQEKRICKACKEEKTLENDFNFHSPTGYYSRTCKDCANVERRKDRQEALARAGVIVMPSSDKKKICIHCKIEKDLNEENFLLNKKKFSSSCRECHDAFILKNKENRQGRHVFKAESTENIKYLTSHRFSVYRRGDFEKGMNFSLSYEFLEECLLSNCVYCGFPATGVDRLDNSLGHTNENCVPCCTQCNRAKQDYFTPEDMKKLGGLIRQIKLGRQPKKIPSEIDKIG